MMAWMNLGDTTGDNMIFGQPSGQALHHGFRQTSYHMGHWGNDIGGGEVVVGEWRHVAFRYEGGLQTILVDGEEVSSGDKDPLDNATHVLIGTTRLESDRSFAGALDEIKIFNEALSDAAIREQMTEVMQTPDPRLVASPSASLGIVAAEPTQRPLSFDVRNAGLTKVLNLSDATLSGPDANHFTSDEAPSSLAPNAVGQVRITFDSKQETGKFSATMPRERILIATTAPLWSPN